MLTTFLLFGGFFLLLLLDNIQLILLLLKRIVMSEERLLLLNLLFLVGQAVGLLLVVQLSFQSPRHKQIRILILNQTHQLLQLLFVRKDGLDFGIKKLVLVHVDLLLNL